MMPPASTTSNGFAGQTGLYARVVKPQAIGGWAMDVSGEDYRHVPHIVAKSSDPAHVSLPGVHRIASLLKRWLLGTHQGAVEADHLQAYLNEFAFRFNRRHSEFRGLLFRRLLEQAVQVEPVSYRSLVGNPSTTAEEIQPPRKHRPHPSSISGTSPGHPWRDHNP
jgi:hypothetical protein